MRVPGSMRNHICALHFMRAYGIIVAQNIIHNMLIIVHMYDFSFYEKKDPWVYIDLKPNKEILNASFEALYSTLEVAFIFHNIIEKLLHSLDRKYEVPFSHTNMGTKL